jgi:CheY-like chemotaxis protein
MDPVAIASLLLVAATHDALQLHRDWLENAGYRVSPASSLKEVEQACHMNKFDLILVADAVEPRMKKAVGMTIRHFFPNAPILQVGRSRPDIAGNCFVTSDTREDVLRSVSRILSCEEIPPAAL